MSSLRRVLPRHLQISIRTQIYYTFENSSDAYYLVIPIIIMPPVLDPPQCKVDGLAFIGLSLTRADETVGNPASSTHQTAFDFNSIQDRKYEYLASTNDDGWLVGGGEPSASYKLSAPDSAHVEIMRVGTFEPELGGISVEDICKAFSSGAIMVPEMLVCPTGVVANGDVPPELEVRFDMKPSGATSAEDGDLPLNWQLRFVHNQLFHYFRFPARFCPGAHHMTFTRKAEFKCPDSRAAYFGKCAQQIQAWKQAGPQPLVAATHDASIEKVSTSETALPADSHDSGVYLFRDRNTISHYFAPNFFYDGTPEKKATILQFINQEWDEKTLSWKVSQPDKEKEVYGLGACCVHVQELVEELFNPQPDDSWKESGPGVDSKAIFELEACGVKAQEVLDGLLDESSSKFETCSDQAKVVTDELLDPKPDEKWEPLEDKVISDLGALGIQAQELVDGLLNNPKAEACSTHAHELVKELLDPQPDQVEFLEEKGISGLNIQAHELQKKPLDAKSSELEEPFDEKGISGLETCGLQAEKIAEELLLNNSES